MKVISYGELTAEEKKEIYKAIVRFYKEHGILSKLKKTGMSLSWFEHRQGNVTLSLVDIMWAPIRQHYLDVGKLRDTETCLKASIEVIKFAEQLYHSNNKNFSWIGNYTIFNEFDFVYTKVCDFYEDLKSCPTILKEEFRELWLSHKDITTTENGWFRGIAAKHKDFFPDR